MKWSARIYINVLQILEINGHQIMQNCELMELMNWLFSFLTDVDHIIIFPHFSPSGFLCISGLLNNLPVSSHYV